MITPDLMVRLMVILAAAWAAGTAFNRLGLPAMLGQMLAGLLMGPAVFGFITASKPLELMADFGIFFVMFPFVVPWPMMGLGIFGAFLQAFIFIMLTMAYLNGAVGAEEH